MADLRVMGDRYFLAGICGAGMSSLALMLESLGMRVRGSDMNNAGPEAQLLRSRGVEVFSETEGAASLRTDEVVVRSTAIHPDNPVLVSAGRLGLSVLHRADLLASLASQYFLIAVSGTHGKTTTAGMIGYVLASENLEPVIYVGGRISGFDRYFPARRKMDNTSQERSIMVLETDESDASFLKFHADVAVTTNIDRDHLGTYGGNFADLVAAFRQFLGQCAERQGLVIGCGDDPEVRHAISRMGRHISYGEAASNQVRIDYDAAENSATVIRGDAVLTFRMKRGDEKSYQNAIAAALACEAVGIRFHTALQILESFPGMERRMQTLADCHGVTVLTDHADHPTEIRATLQSVSVRYPGRRLMLVLQPHRFSRVGSCIEQYGPSLYGANRVVLLEIFAAGETIEDPDGLNQQLRASIRSAIGEHLQTKVASDRVLGCLVESVVSGDVVLFMGPGDVDKLGLRFCTLLSGGNALECNDSMVVGKCMRQEND